jgi:hypothetical protein
MTMRDNLASSSSNDKPSNGKVLMDNLDNLDTQVAKTRLFDVRVHPT